MLKPLFSNDCELVGWIEEGKHIWDVNLNWSAYISNGHAWSAKNGNWLGPLHNNSICLDQLGKVVSWSPGSKIEGTLRPLKPLRALRALTPLRPLNPLSPLRPLRPLTPLSGWSSQSFQDWLNQ